MLDGDRGITYADTVPEGSTLTDGRMVERRAGRPSRWSPSRPSSPRQLGLKVGDTVTVNVLGRNLTATIANLRQVEWRNLGINFVMVFSPGTFRGRAAFGPRHR